IHQLDLMLRSIQIEPGAERQNPADHRYGSDHEITDGLMARDGSIAPTSCPGLTRASIEARGGADQETPAALMRPLPGIRWRAGGPSGLADWHRSPPRPAAAPSASPDESAPTPCPPA